MRVIGLVLRIYSYVFHLLLGLGMMAVSFVAWRTGVPLQIHVLPWRGESLTYWMFFSGLAGVLIASLAIRRMLPWLFTVWALVAVVMLFRGFFLSSYSFGPGSTSLSTALYFTGAALLAFVGSLFGIRRRDTGLLSRRTAVA